MMTGDDISLLHDFAANRTETAFSALVQRHLGLVHSAALRPTGGDAHLAEEIAQKVFILLAQKAGSLGDGTILSAWLYRSAIYVAADTLKQLRRRQFREQEAFMQSQTNEADTAVVWQQLAGLDESMGARPLVLRYFENKSPNEMATALNIGEESAQKRMIRALAKLRSLLAKRGVTLGVTAIAGAVTANAVTVTIAGGLYAAKQAQDARNEIAELKAERMPLTNSLAELTAENQKLSNTLAEVNQQQKLTQSQFNELLKLRGQAGQAQTAVTELAKAQAALKSKQTGMPGYFTNAIAMGMKTALASQKKSAIAKVARMKDALHLTDDQAQAITDIMFKHLEQDNQRMMQAMTSGNLSATTVGENVGLQAGSVNNGPSEEDEIKADLTPDQLAGYDGFTQAEKAADLEKNASMEAQSLTDELSLTSEQQQQIHNLILQDASNPAGSGDASQATAIAAARSSGDYTTMVNLTVQQQLEQITNRMSLFQPVLTPPQLQAFQTSEQEKIDMMKSGLSMLMPQTNSASAQ